MRIRIPRHRQKPEPIIPMINVVFLLLVFFLLTAQIAPQPPFPLTPPDASSQQPARARGVLYVSAQGALAYDDARGEAVWARIAAGPTKEPLEIRADGAVEAATIARILQELRSLRPAGARLVVRGGG